MITIRNDIPTLESKIFFHGVEVKSPIPNTVASATADVGDKIIVIFNHPDFNYANLPAANAFGFDRKGNLLWPVQPFIHEHRGDPYIIFQIEPDTGRLILGTFDGYRAALNTDSGTINLIPNPRPY